MFTFIKLILLLLTISPWLIGSFSIGMPSGFDSGSNLAGMHNGPGGAAMPGGAPLPGTPLITYY